MSWNEYYSDEEIIIYVDYETSRSFSVERNNKGNVLLEIDFTNMKNLKVKRPYGEWIKVDSDTFNYVRDSKVFLTKRREEI